MKTDLMLQLWHYHLNAIRPSFERLSDGEITRLQGLMYLLHHDSYHVGQMVLAHKKGREIVLGS